MDDPIVPGELITEVPDGYENSRVFLVLPDQRKLPLPLHPRNEEFALPGNVEIHNDGDAFAVYDESTRTGALLLGAKAGIWTMWQPITRDAFFLQQVPESLRITKIWAKFNL